MSIRRGENEPALFVDGRSVQSTWELVMTDPEGNELKVNPLERHLAGNADVTDGRLTMTWDAAEVPGGTVKVSCVFETPDGPLAEQAGLSAAARKEPLLLGGISMVNESNCDLREVQFPRMTFIAAPGPAANITLVFPRAYGRSWRNPFDAPRGYLVGTQEPAGLRGSSEMNFGTLYDDDGNGLYWAHYDPEGWQKRTVYDNRIPPDQIQFKLCCIPENCTTPGVDFASPYPMALGVYRGDWWDAARMYREWALRQKRCSKGPWRHRDDVPAWLKECDVWVRGDARRYTAEFERDFITHLQDVLGGATVGVQLYGWYQPEPGKADWMATLGWPMVEGYPEMIEETKARRIYHTPYVNAYQTDIADPFCPENIEPAYLLGADLQPMHYHSESGFVMCAATDIWRDMLVRACERLVAEGHTSGVYLDQLGGHCGVPCYSPDHGHPVGGGHYATDGLRDICAAIRQAMWKHDPQAALSGEVQQETLLDVTDHRLQHYNYWPGWVNLWAAVYGDMTSSYGRTIGFRQSPDKEGNPPPPIDNYGPIGNTFVSGLVFGRLWPTGNPMNLLDAEGNEELRAFFTDLVGLRRVARRWLEFGYLQRPVRFAEPIPDVPIKDPKGRDSSIKAVLDSAWIDEEGALAFVFVNVSEEEQTFTWRADLATYEIAPAEVYHIRRILPDGSREMLGSFETGRNAVLEREETAPAHSALVLEVAVGAY
ncbi:MAG: hypothetical protein J7M38_04935 [Armatimonadetes bacterium]|nr:hypothetical protein [Armatimonadota bacterium]